MTGYRALASAAVLLSFLCVLTPAAVLAQVDTASYAHVEGEVLLKFWPETSASQRATLLQEMGATETEKLVWIGAGRYALGTMSVEEAIDRFQDHPDLEYIEPNHLWFANEVPSDPLFDELWGLQNTGQFGGTPGADIDAVSAWDVSTGSSQVIVAIIDTGVDYSHPDLLANIFTNLAEIPGNGIDDDNNGFIDDVRGWDFANNDNDPFDDAGHGTHVAGTVGAQGNNGEGVVGVNWQVRLLPVKFLSASGSGTTAAAVSSIAYATLMGADVMNNSWGGGPFSQAMLEAIEAANAAGIVFVAAAGNWSTNNDFSPHYPSSYEVENVIAVAATGPNDELAGFSSFGLTTVDLAAPGVATLSTIPGASYGYADGTSMATPHVSGVAALLLGRFPNMTVLDVRNRILSTVDPVPALQNYVATGGRLNAFNAIADPDSIPPDPITDLSVVQAGTNRLRLEWTATGDDGVDGTASSYEVRHADFPIDASNFALAALAAGPPDPDAAGQLQQMWVDGLSSNTTYWFAIIARDEFGNSSSLSNVPSGNTLGDPDISVAPATLNAALLTGARTTSVLTVSNSSAGELSFEISVEGVASGNASVEVVGGSFLEQPEIVARGNPVSVSELRKWNAELPAELFVDGDAPIDRNALHAPVNLKLSGLEVEALGEEVFGSPQNAYSAGPRTRGNIFHCTETTSLLEHRFYLEHTGPTQMWFLVYEGAQQIGEYRLVSASDVSPAGPGLGWYSSGDVDVAFRAGYYYLVVCSFEAFGTYFNEVDVVPYPVAASFGELIAGVGWDWAPEAIFPPLPSSFVPDFAFGAPVAYYQTLVTGVGTRWLSVDPDGAFVPPFASADVLVSFDAAGLSGGSYDADLVLSSNDPDQPTLSVPAHLEVTGAPDIMVEPPDIDFGWQYIGASTEATLRIVNAGTDLLTISGLALAGPDFLVDPVGFDLAPRESHEVVISFVPTRSGLLSDLLFIDSNDPDEPSLPVRLDGEGIEPPIIAVSPGSLSASLFTGESANEALIIENQGVTELNFQIALRAPAAAEGLRSGAASEGGLTLRHPEAMVPVAISPGGRLWSADLMGQSEPQSESRPALESERTVGGLELLILHAGDVSTIAAELRTFEDVGLVDVFDGSSVVPTLEDLVFYDAVILAPNGFFADPMTLGDRLADYVDQGGGVVQTTPSFLPGWSPGGRFLSDGYSPFEGGFGPIGSASLGNFDPAHPIMAGVSTAFGDLLASTVLSTDATWIADWAIAEPFVATKGDHVVGVNAFVAGGGPTWSGDVALVLRNAARWSASPQWLQVEPLSGSVAPQTDQALDVLFEAAGLVGGIYEASIVISSNDPLQPEFIVPAQLSVTGAPDISVEPLTLDFGPVFLTATGQRTLVVTNEGTDVLFVTSIVSDAPEFTADLDTFSLAPTASRDVVVSFAPVLAGAASGTLTITSNDTDEANVAVTLSGEGREPPIVWVTPPALTESLFTGQTSTQTLTIANDGASPLEFTLVAEEVVVAAVVAKRGDLTVTSRQEVEVKGARQSRGDPETAGVSSSTGYRVVYGSTPQAVLLYADDYARSAGSHYVDLALQHLGIPYTAFYNDLAGFENALRNGTWDLVIVDNNNFYPSANLWNAVEAFYLGGGSVLVTTFDADASAGTTTLWTTLGVDVVQDNTLASPVYAWSPTHQLFNHPEEVPDFVDMPDEYFDDGDRVDPMPPAVAVAGYTPSPAPGQGAIVLASTGRAVMNAFLVVENDADADADGLLDAVELFINEISYLSGPSWLDLAPRSGTVLPAQFVDVVVTFDATGQLGGAYDAEIRVVSNDPVNPQLTVTAHLDVTGAPDITVSETALDFGPVFVLGQSAQTLRITNDGTDQLLVSSITTSDGQYTVDVTSTSLAPGQFQDVVVTFTPATAGSFPADITILSNDPDEPSILVTLSGEGVNPPDIAVSPASLTESLITGQTSTQTLTIDNAQGQFDLQWQIQVSALAGTFELTVPATGTESLEGGPPPADPRTTPIQAELDDLTGMVVVWDRSGDQIPASNWSTILADLELRGATIVENFDPVVPSLLGDADIFWSTDVGWAWDVAARAALVDFLRQGGAILLEGDESTPTFNALLADAGSGIVMSSVSPIAGVTTDIESHPTMVNVSSLYLNNPLAELSTITPPAGSLVGGPGGRALVAYEEIGLGRLIVAGDELFHDGAVGLEDNQLFGNRVIDWLRGVDWISVAPSSGTTAPGLSTAVAVTFDATGLYGGLYDANLVVSSNDPDEPELVVPAHLDVTGAPNVGVEPSSLSFGDVSVGRSTILSLRVRNTGTDLLNVTSITAALPDYEIMPQAFTLAPGSHRFLTVEFSPVEAGDRSTVLEIVSNSPASPHSVSVQGAGFLVPDLVLSSEAVSLVAAPAGSGSETLTLMNQGPGPLDFRLLTTTLNAQASAQMLKATGGPDAFGHGWIDSDQPGGPAFEWMDIKGSGTLLIPPTPADDVVYPAGEIGFSFPYFGYLVSSFWISSDGWITFSAEDPSPDNRPLPSSSAPAAMLAALWDDLDLTRTHGGEVYKLFDGRRLILQYDDVPRGDGLPGRYTFQIILYPNGDIVYQYHTLDGITSSATVGMQDRFRGDGLTIAHNQSYLHEGLAIRISEAESWLSVVPSSGTIAPGASLDVEIRGDASAFGAGTFGGRLYVLSNDPDRSIVPVDVTLRVGTTIATETRIHPNRILREGNDQPIVALVELAPEFDATLVDLSSVRLMGSVVADQSVDPLGDFNDNGNVDMRFEFPRAQVEAVLQQDGDVLLVVSGILEDVSSFMALGAAKVILPFMIVPNGGERLMAGSSTEFRWENPEGWPVDSAALSVSTDGGASWTTVASGLSATSATVQLPAIETEQALCRVHFFNGTDEIGYDTSDGFFTITTTVTGVEPDELVFGLFGNAPNPFGTSTVLRFGLSQTGKASLRIYDLRGRLVRTLIDEFLPAGRHHVSWTGRDDSGSPVASGVYFYRLEAEGRTEIRRMTLQQ